ncbi:assimilatory sulfite reductase (NADPH) hemoprotein subunit [Benzoatithermus flavus]|uniref:Sulfite reductase [NADPH] hemoprotein beta-component n=1 Tax=Benzoatithermus flavus TaxID=3108223 RepID=A0ABU8XNG8_9PROT
MTMDRSRDVSQPVERLSGNERLKAASRRLRGDIVEGLADPVTGGISPEAQQLLKFHGSYQQDDRDLRDERRRQKLEPAYEFMVRVRLPGGVCRPDQWLKLDELARTYANGTLRLTTRQTFQFHGILKRDMRKTIQGMNQVLLDSIAACGDVNRGVMCSINPHLSALHQQVYELAKATSEHLLPRTRAYHEIWLEQEPVAGSGEEEEPIYGPTYLPRKFKIGFVIPPENDVDVYTQDLGFIAIVENGKLEGFNVTVGGGMGRADNEPGTYPRLADVAGFIRPDQVVRVAEEVVKIQRDYGDRVDRKHARFKYTIDDRGLDWFKDEIASRLGWRLEEPRPFVFTTNGDRYGWAQGDDGCWHYTLFVENGRVKDTADLQLMTALRTIAAVHEGEFRLTPNQNLIISRIKDTARARIQSLIEAYGLDSTVRRSVLRRNSMACVALPTCALAMAESERYLPQLVTKLEKVMAEHGLAEEPIIVRMTGCPNGCARPYVAEIAFTGRAPGKYNVYLGGGFHGQRLNRMLLENVGEPVILETLTPIIARYAKERVPGERFGDFVIRAGIIREVKEGRDFNG